MPASRLAMLGLALLWSSLGSSPLARAQPAAASGNGWDAPVADVLADYLLSGQQPHPAVARIIAPEGTGVSLGSGVLVDANQTQGLVLTNWHVIRDSRSAVLVQFPDGFQSAGTVIRFDEAWDLAAIAIWKPPVEPVPLAAMPPVIGEPLTIAGYGRGAYRAQSGPCTDYLSPGTGYTKEFVELAAAARQGDSGGPILNADGHLAGILFGQSEGRTIGSCSTRLKTFLASVGSRGIAPAQGTVATVSHRPAAPSSRASPDALAALPEESAAQRSAYVPVPAASGPATMSRSADPAAPAAWGQQQAGPQPWAVSATSRVPAAGGPGSPRPFVENLWEALANIQVPASLATEFDPWKNGRIMLEAAGGAALFVIGLRTLWRRRGADGPRR